MKHEHVLSMIEKISAEYAEWADRFRTALKAAMQSIFDAIKPAIAKAIADDAANRQRIAQTIATIPQHLRGNPMCRDPWHRGKRP